MFTTWQNTNAKVPTVNITQDTNVKPIVNVTNITKSIFVSSVASIFTTDLQVRSNFYVLADTSLNNRLFLLGDASFSGAFYVAKDASVNSRLFVKNDEDRRQI